jgi:hypothetical protein
LLQYNENDYIAEYVGYKANTAPLFPTFGVTP